MTSAIVFRWDTNIEVFTIHKVINAAQNESTNKLLYRHIWFCHVNASVYTFPYGEENENLRDGENFINGFPSTNDYNAYESFASNAEVLNQMPMIILKDLEELSLSPVRPSMLLCKIHLTKLKKMQIINVEAIKMFLIKQMRKVGLGTFTFSKLNAIIC